MADLLNLLPSFVRTPTLVPVLAVYIPAALLLLHAWRAAWRPSTDYEPEERR